VNLFAELKRRNVIRVGIAYVLIAWVVLQGADFAFDLVGAPEWVIRALFALAAIGLPAALIIAWVFEMTPEGIKREKDIDRSQSIAPLTGRKLDRVIIGILTIAVGGAEPEPATDTRTTPPGTADRDNPSIAVLPFVNMSADEDKEYFSDGMTEEIINALVRIPGLDVAARTSVFAYKGMNRDVRELGAELNVAHVLEGSVRSDARSVRITAQLIKVDDGFHLWSETFDRELVNVFAIQEEIASSIASVLTNRLSKSWPTAVTQNISVEAYDDYLRGRAFLRARSDNDVTHAISLFQSVTERFPDYAPAWAALAISADVANDHPYAERSARRALELDPENVDALNALAAVYRDTWRWAESESLFERALAIDPDSSELLEDYGEFLGATGRVKEQLEVTQRGYGIDPYLTPLIGVHAQALVSNGAFERALEVLERVNTQPDSRWLGFTKVLPLSAMGDEAAIRSLVVEADIPDASRDLLLGLMDRPEGSDAERLMQEQVDIDWASVDEAVITEFILLHIGANEFILNFELERFKQIGWGSSEYFFTPLFAGFRQQPRFIEMLNLIGLPDYWDETGWPEFCARLDTGEIQCQ
jgi:TolB-like protein/Tfp pilus assembly protein PilF